MPINEAFSRTCSVMGGVVNAKVGSEGARPTALGKVTVPYSNDEAPQVQARFRYRGKAYCYQDKQLGPLPSHSGGNTKLFYIIRSSK